jgi:ABC-type sugar transport system substrate-binding protein
MKAVDVYSAAAGSACVTRQVVPDKAVTRSVLARLRRVAGVALLACAGSTLASGAAAAANKVRIGVVGALSDASFYIADAKGYFKEEGVDVEIIEFQNSAQVIAPSFETR